LTVPLQAKFDQINAHARAILPELLREWFPLGRMITKTEYGVANLNGDPGESLSINIKTGKWKEFAGGPGGHEPLGLYAHAFCNGDRKQAFKELRAKFGFSDDAPPPRTRARGHLKLVTKDEPAEWVPMVPPPDDVPGPNVTDWDHVFVYRDQGGRLLRYVVRNEAKNGERKKVRPLTYGIFKGAYCWKQLGPNEPKSLYGLERLDNAPVLLQEGELKTDQVQALLPGMACLSLTGGTGQAALNDLGPLAEREIIYCGDNDKCGRETAYSIAAKLAGLGATVRIVDVWSHGFPEGWDLGDAVKDGWTAERIEAFLKDNARDHQRDAGNPDPELDDYEQDPDDEGPAGRDKRSRPPIPLGYDSGHYYYLSPMTGQIEVLARKSHTKHELIGIADLQWYWRLGDQYKNKDGNLKWDEVGNLLKGWCSDMGVYNPDKARGRGAWLDTHIHTGEVRAVMNLGNWLLVNGESLPLLLPGSVYIYEAARPLKYVEAPPLTKEQAGEVAELCKLFSWEKPIYGTLMAGWLAVAPICGALFWRPAIWVTGGSGSGKSTLEALIVKPLLGDIGLFLKGGTTEAGVRQKLGRDARPLLFDEAEAESQKSKGTLQGLLELNRQSSSEGGAEIIKGTQNQTGAKTYHVKSCFSFSSINPTLDHMADENRMSVLELTSHGAEARAGFDAFVDRINRTMTPEFCAGFVARSVWLMPVILDNARTFSKAVAVHLGSSRIGDQVGTLLAGAFSGISDNRVSPETARKWVEQQDWSDTTSADAEPDERRMLNHLMQQRVTLDLGSRKEDLTLAEVVQMASGTNGEVVAAFANAELKRNGLWYDGDGVWIANDHKALKKHLEGTPWSSQWDRTLRRLPGTKARDRGEAAIRFAGGRCRATFVPMDLIE
jgi:putative DNA primase/helicase